ncbi:hypothetical protein Nepgr_031779 [Nepenthes gracilis]|uniref:Uncharacterized protein n=1 Tax=Nepenthes gracilis TaxID=150966 RepID=A0AAD3TIS4_NEPGR|nr:hypothetical protein Nepgr_031779 [Nepenthes gracilis]
MFNESNGPVSASVVASSSGPVREGHIAILPPTLPQDGPCFFLLATRQDKGTSPLKTGEVSHPPSVCRPSSLVHSPGSPTSLPEDVGTHTNLASDANLLPGMVIPCTTLAPTSVEDAVIVRKSELLRAPGSVLVQEAVPRTLKASWSSVVKQQSPGGFSERKVLSSGASYKCPVEGKRLVNLLPSVLNIGPCSLKPVDLLVLPAARGPSGQSLSPPPALSKDVGSCISSSELGAPQIPSVSGNPDSYLLFPGKLEGSPSLSWADTVKKDDLSLNPPLKFYPPDKVDKGVASITPPVDVLTQAVVEPCIQELEDLVPAPCIGNAPVYAAMDSSISPAVGDGQENGDVDQLQPAADTLCDSHPLLLTLKPADEVCELVSSPGVVVAADAFDELKACLGQLDSVPDPRVFSVDNETQSLGVTIRETTELLVSLPFPAKAVSYMMEPHELEG